MLSQEHVKNIQEHASFSLVEAYCFVICYSLISSTEEGEINSSRLAAAVHSHLFNIGSVEEDETSLSLYLNSVGDLVAQGYLACRVLTKRDGDKESGHTDARYSLTTKGRVCIESTKPNSKTSASEKRATQKYRKKTVDIRFFLNPDNPDDLKVINYFLGLRGDYYSSEKRIRISKDIKAALARLIDS